ncbi:MAG: hypothetical protein JST59_00285 [Actinobacteria bacterium]|nr:hypothetical protein [Actinomycetota bacterium]
MRQEEIRTILRQTRFNKHCESGFGFLRIVMITTLQLLLIPLWVFFAALLLPALAIGLVVGLYAVLSPLMLIFVVTVMPGWSKKHIIVIICIVVLYPVVAALMLLLMVLFVVSYLCIRDRFEYHHGIYDPIIELGLMYVIWFLSVFKSIVAM